LKDNVYTVFYAGILGVACALLLTGAATFTAPYAAKNAKGEEVRNILSALGVSFEKSDTVDQLLERFAVSVHPNEPEGNDYFLYSPSEDWDNPTAVAMRFVGPGLWGPIKGFLATESDMRTIRAVTFYHQEETPGLGGEIASDDFLQQFVDKTIVDDAGEIGFVIGAGGDETNSVDAISGATMTCDKLEIILNDVMKRLVEETDGRQ
jgi:Na+-transporting NADH:ubiquinone oxidoreductase subunit C